MSAVHCTGDDLLPLSTCLIRTFQAQKSFSPKDFLCPSLVKPLFFHTFTAHDQYLAFGMYHFLMNIMVIYTCDKGDLFIRKYQIDIKNQNLTIQHGTDTDCAKTPT